jgi:hypothetical protein
MHATLDTHLYREKRPGSEKLNDVAVKVKLIKDCISSPIYRISSGI